MNAKLAVAISLGASSLALFGMAGVANAETVTPPNSDTNPTPVVQPSTDNQVEKAKGEAQKAINDANAQKNKIDEDVNKSESEATDANSDAEKAKQAVTTAQNELKEKHTQEQTAEEEKGKADKELADQKTAVDKADKDVEAKQAALDQETANQTAAENKLKATQKEKGKAEGELGTANEEIQTKTTEQTKAGEKVKTETGKLDTANTELQTAQTNKENAQKEADRLSSEADQKEQAQKEAEQAVTDNENQKEEKNKEIKRLQEHKSADEDPNVKKLKGEAEQAHEAYTKAQGELNQKTNDIANDNNTIQSETEKLNNAKTALEQNEDGKKFKDAQDKVEEAEKEAKEAEDAYNKANTEKLDANVQKGFDGFLDYIISKYKNDNSAKGKAIYEDAQRAKDILTGKDVVIPDTVTKTADGGEITHKGRTIKAPMWYKDLVKLKRVGGADSLKNLQDAATYYKPLNEERTSIGLNALNVNLSMIAESIVNSYYSGAVIEHSVKHADYNSASSMNTHPYLDSSENLAWGPFDNYDANKRTHGSKPNSQNAMDGWYDAEKAIYDEAINTGKCKDKNNKEHNFSERDIEFLKAHRYDFMHQTYSSDAVDSDFESAVGHYLNFVDNKINSCGFADSNNSVALNEDGENVVVWHGSEEKSQLSVEEFTKSLNEYIANLTGTRDSANKLEPSNAENLKSLSAKITEKNKKLFDAKYELRKVQYDLNMTPDGENTPLQTREKDDLQAQKTKIENAKNDLDKEIEKIEKFVQEYAKNPTGAWGPNAKQDYEHDVKSYLPWAKSQSSDYAEEISRISSELEGLNAKIASSSAKGNVVTSLVKNVKDANTKIADANAKLVEDTRAKESLVQKVSELNTAAQKAKQEAQTAEQAATQASQESKEKRDQQIQQLQTALQGLEAKAETLKTEAQRAKTDAETARTAADNKQAEVNGTLTQNVKAAQENVDTATKAVATAEAAKKQADTELKKAKDKVSTLQQTIQTLETQIATENQKVTEANGKVQAAQTALQGALKTQEQDKSAFTAATQKAQKAAEKVETEKAAVEDAKKAVVEKIKLAQTAVANAQAKVKHAKEVVAEAKTKIEKIKKNLETKKTTLTATTKDEKVIQELNAIFLAAYKPFDTFIETMTGKVSALQDTAKNLSTSATALTKHLQTVSQESVTPPVPVPPAPAPAPAPSPAPVPPAPAPVPTPAPAPSGDTTVPGSESGSSSDSSEESSGDYAGSSDHSGSNWYDQYLAGYAKNLFGNEQLGFHSAVPAAQSQSANGANGANAQNANGVAANNVAGAAHANRIAAALAAAGAKAAVKDLAKAQDAAKDSAAKSESNKDNAKNDAKDSAKSESKSESKEDSKEDSKSAQASGDAQNGAQSASNSTTIKIVAAIATVVAGIAAIGGGTYFARHRRA